MAIRLNDLIQNPETAPFSKLKYLKRRPEDEVTQFFNRLFLLSVTGKETGDWSILDKFLEEEGDRIASQVAPPIGFDYTPWAPFQRRLSESKIAILTTGGIYVEGQKPFNTDGDSSYREIPLDTPTDMFRIAHTHYDTIGVAEDINSVLAIHRLQEIIRDGIVAESSTSAYSFMGYIPDPSDLIKVTAPEVARRLNEERVDGVVIGTT